MSEQPEPRELTGDEQRDLTRRMEVVGAVVSGVQTLLYRRDPLAEEIKEYAGRLRSKWAIGLVAVALVVAWTGRDWTELSWLQSAGTVLFLLLAFWFLGPLPDWFRAERKLEQIDAQLWEMHYRWLANGGHDAQFNDLKALHQPDMGIDFDSSEYREWWYEVRAKMREKAMLLA